MCTDFCYFSTNNNKQLSTTLVCATIMDNSKKKWSHIDIPFMGSYYIPFILNNIHNKYILPCLYDIIIQNTEHVTPFDTFKGHLCIEMTMLLNSCVWQIWIIFKSLLTLWQEFLIFQIVDKAFTDYKRHSLPLSWFGRAVGLYPEQFMHIVEHKRWCRV